MNTFAFAGPAEIVRAKQKDDTYSDRLQRIWLDIVQKCAGTQWWLVLRTYPVGHFLYGAATSLSGLQTLGEEYTGILQVDSSLARVSPFMNRLLMIILDNFGGLILISLLNCFERSIKKHSRLQPQAKQDLLEAIKVLKQILPFLERCHRALFYCGGVYYQLSKRITGIHYVLVRRWLKDYQSLYGFKLLGIVTSVHLMVTATYLVWQWIFSHSPSLHIEKDSTSSYISERKCPLCLESRRNTSATPCGHLFCWSCILEWLQTCNQCPICRETIEPSRIIPLQNYL